MVGKGEKGGGKRSKPEVVVFDLPTLEHDSATHNGICVIHGIFLPDFSLEV